MLHFFFFSVQSAPFQEQAEQWVSTVQHVSWNSWWVEGDRVHHYFWCFYMWSFQRRLAAPKVYFMHISPFLCGPLKGLPRQPGLNCNSNSTHHWGKSNGGGAHDASLKHPRRATLAFLTAAHLPKAAAHYHTSLSCACLAVLDARWYEILAHSYLLRHCAWHPSEIAPVQSQEVTRKSHHAARLRAAVRNISAFIYFSTARRAGSHSWA